jgi:hypothetical protein
MRASSPLLAGFLLTAVLVVYVSTAAPDLALVDSAELALTAATGGVAHPPGVPLYLLAGRVFAALPVSTPARALNLMSAFWMACGVTALFLAAERLLAFLGAEPGRRALAALAGAVVFATSYNPWTWSAVAEVYALNVFLLATAWLFAWRAAVGLADAKPFRGRRPAELPPGVWRDITAGAIFAALGLANHHATATLAFPTLILLVALVRPALLRTRRLWITAFAAVAGALALYLYLFVAARNDPGLNWGGIDSLPLLFRHVIGSQYAEQVGSPPGESVRVAGEFFRTLVDGCGWPATALLLLGAIGLVRGTTRPGRRPERVVLAALLATVALNLVLSMNYIAGPEDRMAYDLPATAAWALLVAVGAGGLMAAAGRRGPRFAAGAGVLVIVVAGGANVVHNLPLCDLGNERTARLYVEETLGSLPEGSVVLSAEWNLYAPYLYLRHLEGWRTDLGVIDVLMMRRHWYLDYVAREMPELVQAAPVEFERFREQIRRFDLGQPYDRANIQGWYEDLLFAWIRNGQARGGAYAEWSCRDHPQEASWLARATLVPEDLLLRFPALGEVPGAPIVAPKDRANLEWIRSRLNDASADGDRTAVPLPRHDPYWKVWRSYAISVDASLLVAARTGEDTLLERWNGLRPWFPDADRALARIRAQTAGR